MVGTYKPKGWEQIPDGLKDPQGHWFAIHSGTLGIMVNVDALGGLPVPQSWGDLLKPEYKGMVGYLDPSSAFVGYVSAVAINQAMGGSLNDFTPAIDYFQKLAKKNSPIVPKQTAYARVLSGELPILVDYDFNAYRARYKDKANVAFVIPKEGSISVPYVMSIVGNAPHRANAEKVLDFVLSEQGQALWAKAYLRPVRAMRMPADVAAQFLPDSDYARAGVVNYEQMAAAQEAFFRALPERGQVSDRLGNKSPGSLVGPGHGAASAADRGLGPGACGSGAVCVLAVAAGAPDRAGRATSRRRRKRLLAGTGQCAIPGQSGTDLPAGFGDDPRSAVGGWHQWGFPQSPALLRSFAVGRLVDLPAGIPRCGRRFPGDFAGWAPRLVRQPWPRAGG
nr:hypothetical protein GCM10020185_76350 [Pseudomonas brassicacearum subsp. brassicacearum]